MPTTPVGLPIQLGSESDFPPLLGEPVAFNLNRSVPGSDAPAMTFLIYPLPPGMALMPVSRSAQTILPLCVSSQQDRWSSAEPRTHNVYREGPFDAYCAPMHTGECPLVATGLPGCPYLITSYTGLAVADTNPAFGIQLHHTRFFIGVLEFARLLFRSPTFWIQNMDMEDAVAAAVNLQRDAGPMLNLQILCQFVTSLQRMSSEVLSLALGQVVFPSQEVAALSPAPRWGYGVLSWALRSRACTSIFLQRMYELQVLFPEWAGPSRDLNISAVMLA